MTAHLIVIRGNSAVGKTTLAARLQRALGRGTANIGQDHFRRVVLREHDVPGGANIAFLEHTARYCLGIGYHVILEGILARERYGEMLARLLADHPHHVYYLDASLAATLERHAGRPLAAEVTPDLLRGWYCPDDQLGVPGEVTIPGDLDADAVLQRVLADTRHLARPDDF